MEKSSGFKITPSLATKLIKAVVYGDLLQKMLLKNRAYEVKRGQTQKVYNKWLKKCQDIITQGNLKDFKNGIYQMVDDFENIQLNKNIVKPKVGVVGEILIKYHPYGNNYVIDVLENEGAEVIMPDFMGFVKFMATHAVTKNELLKDSKLVSDISKLAIKLLDKFEKDATKALSKSKKGYMLPCSIWDLEDKVKEILSIGNQTGEGWFLTAEMIEYIENGVANIVCVQPFACLPNHVVGKGVIKTIRKKFPQANISPIDYDPGASQTNQINRIKLLITVAKDNLKIKENASKFKVSHRKMKVKK